VVLRPFHLGWQAKNAPGNRALRLVEDVAALTEERAVAEYERVLRDFKVVVASNCVQDQTDEEHRDALKKMADVLKARIAHSSRVILRR
jgi:hypothetical protein